MYRLQSSFPRVQDSMELGPEMCPHTCNTVVSTWYSLTALYCDTDPYPTAIGMGHVEQHYLNQ